MECDRHGIPPRLFRAIPRFGDRGPRKAVPVWTAMHGVFWLRTGDYLSRRIADRRPYEPAVSAAVQRFLNEGDNFVDIGAHFGYHSLTAACRVGPSGSVLSIEPDPQNFIVLTKNVAGHPNITAINVAAGARLKVDRLHGYHQLNSGLSSFGPARIEIRGRVPKPTQGPSVVKVPVDELICDNSRPIKMIKIDAESHEIQVLTGLTHTIERDRPIVLVEIGDFKHVRETTAQLLNKLSELGYLIPDHLVGVVSHRHGNVVLHPATR